MINRLLANRGMIKILDQNIVLIFFIYIMILLSYLIIYVLVQILSINELKNQIYLVGISLTLLILLVGLNIYNFILINFLICSLAVTGGSLMKFGFKDENSLIVFLITASIIDIISFSGGFTHFITSSYLIEENVLLLYLAISIPFNNNTIPIIGFGDLFILSVIITILMETKRSNIEIIIASLSGLLLALTLGLMFGGIYAIPFISISVILYISIRNNLTKKDSQILP